MIDAIDWTALDHTSPLLSALPEPARRASRMVSVARSAPVFLRGDRPRAMYFVVSGEVHLSRFSREGTDIVLQRTRHGFIAEASLDQPRYHCDAIAVRPSVLLAVTRRPFVTALETKTFRNLWMRHLAHELRRLRTQAERLSLKRASERIIHYIETEGHDGIVCLNQSKKDWATELGLTHEALYRALSRLEIAGRIDIAGARISLSA